MTLYHELSPDALVSALREGLRRTSRGEKGQDDAIKKTDAYLDQHCPAPLRAKGVSRDDNIYAYLGTEDTLIDIRDGRTVPLTDRPDPTSKLLRLSVDPAHCYVSDLERYDAVKRAIDQHSDTQLAALATEYWQHITPLASYGPGSIRRPEIMITCDLAPHALTPLDIA